MNYLRNNKILNILIIFSMFQFFSIPKTTAAVPKVNSNNKLKANKAIEGQVIRAVSFTNKKGKTKLRPEWIDLSVTTSEIATGAVTSAKIADGTISSADLAADSVTGVKIADGTIDAANLASASVTSSKILDGTVASGDLATNAVTTSKIQNGTITRSDISSAVTGLQSATFVVATDSSGDYTDIQTAIDNTPTTGGKIIIKEGTYDITASILPVSNLIIAGVGTASIIRATASIGSMFFLSSKSNVTIQNLYLNCDSNATRGVDSIGSREVKILDSSITGSTSYVMYFDGTDSNLPTRITISNNILTNGGIGVHLDNTSDCVVSNNFVDTIGTLGIRSENSSGNLITGNHVSNCTGHGIYAGSSFNHSTISENTVHTSDIGILMSDSDYSSIHDNNIFSNGDTGLYSGGDYCSINNNKISNNNGHGIYNILGDDNLINNNSIFSNTGDGIRIRLSDRTSMVGNHIQGHSSGSGILIQQSGSEDNFRDSAHNP